MTQGIKKNEKSGRAAYPDIFDLPHWQSPTRPHMSLYDRAAQFAPFAALSGYDEMVGEEARLVDQKIELEETSLERLNQKLGLIADVIEDGTKPTVSITFFIPDPLKAGGRYETVTEQVKKIDTVERTVVLEKKVGIAGMNMEIRIEDILDIKGELVDYMDDIVD